MDQTGLFVPSAFLIINFGLVLIDLISSAMSATLIVAVFPVFSRIAFPMALRLVSDTNPFMFHLEFFLIETFVISSRACPCSESPVGLIECLACFDVRYCGAGSEISTYLAIPPVVVGIITEGTPEYAAPAIFTSCFIASPI